ncbi:MAG TPA: sialidase family protein [Aquella sp.]|nr:sialidase family protein [Aquella sp.]
MSKPGYKWINVNHVFTTVYILALCFTISLIYVSTLHTIKPKFKLNNYIQQYHNSNIPIFESYIIQQPASLIASHSTTFEVLANGNLLAFWFAGSHEGKPDVKIWSSRFRYNRWTDANKVVAPQMLSSQLSQYVRKVGNPVVYKASNGVLHLFVVSVGAIGGWSGSNIEHLQSADNGITWKKAQKLILSPLLNISTLVRTRAIPLADSGFYLPVYHEMIYKYPELLRFDAEGNFMGKIRMTSQRDLLQPALVPLTENFGYSFLRNKGNHDRVLYMQYTINGGLSWSRPGATNLFNRDSSIAVALLYSNRYESQQILMVHNPLDRGRLVLSISDDGVTFRDIAVLEDKPRMEYSYPSIQVHDGLIDILYTYERQKIKHVRFNQAWLDGQGIYK